jgi:hypothetical protein
MRKLITPGTTFPQRRRLGFWEKINSWRNKFLTTGEKLKLEALELVEKIAALNGERRSQRIRLKKMGLKFKPVTNEEKSEELRKFRVPGYLALLKIISS